MVSDLEERVCEVFLKSADMLEEMKKLRNEKLNLEVRLLGQLKELKKALDDISELEKKIASNQSEIATLRKVNDREHAEKLELRHQVQLERDLEHCEADIKELRDDSECQSITTMNFGRPTTICSWRQSAALSSNDLELWQTSRGC